MEGPGRRVNSLMSDSFIARRGDEVCRAETAGRVVRGSLRPWERRVVRKVVGMKLILMNCCMMMGGMMEIDGWVW